MKDNVLVLLPRNSEARDLKNELLERGGHEHIFISDQPVGDITIIYYANGAPVSIEYGYRSIDDIIYRLDGMNYSPFEIKRSK